MTVQAQIVQYIASLPPQKGAELSDLHRRVMRIAPDSQLWFLDGRNEDGKIVSNPSIGYGAYEQVYADGKSRDFYRVGMSANTSGISVYVMGLEDRKYLPETYGSRLGKATITGYCIKFRSLSAIDIDVLEEIIAGRMAGA